MTYLDWDIIFLRFSNPYEDMILVELNGGIGNQMFQYAAAKSLALHHKTELKLDITPAAEKNMPDELKHRPFDLHHFNLTDPIASTIDIQQLTSRSPVEKLLEKAKPNHKRKIYREPFFHYDNNFFETGTNVYLKGLWQSEKYFLRYNNEIRNIFLFKNDMVNSFKDIARSLRNQNSVSIHIRRGDYLAKISQDILGLLPIEYYQKSIELIKSKIANPRFYFFSDDINWVKKNLLLPGAVYVSEELSKNRFEDLYLMTQCRHNIIANSSFSWWGAWLNDNPDKIVIAPKNWFNKGPKDTYDLYPSGWIII